MSDVSASNPDEEPVKATLGTSNDGSIYADGREDDDADGESEGVDQTPDGEASI